VSVRIYAHRGAWGEGIAQNSPESFDRAVEVGADGIECDVRLTRDFVPLLSHDPSIGGVVIAECSFSELQERLIPLGIMPSPLVPALERARSLRCNVEIKPDSAGRGAVVPQVVLDCLRDSFGSADLLARFEISSFDLSIVKAISTLEPSLASYLLVDRFDSVQRAVRSAVEYGLTGINLEYHRASPVVIHRVTRAGLALGLWTVDRASVAKRLSYSLVAHMITNRVSSLISVVRS
jgi:glycerophosphoryl diester phosphodiesterase